MQMEAFPVLSPIGRTVVSMAVQLESRVQGVTLTCPDYIPLNFTFTCIITIQQGSNMQGTIHFGDGNYISVTPAGKTSNHGHTHFVENRVITC